MVKLATQVYEVGTDVLDDYSYGYSYPKGFDNLWKKQLRFVVPAGVETVAARSKRRRYVAGRRLISDPFPRLLIKEGPKRPIQDFEQTMGFILVSERFRGCLEGCEPGIHQFEPVKVQWKDGSHAAGMYVLVICNAIDSLSAEHTDGIRELIKYEMHGGWELLGPWKSEDGGLLKKPVFDLSAINTKCLWRDEFFRSGPLCSDVFKLRYESDGLTGMDTGKRDAV